MNQDCRPTWYLRSWRALIENREKLSPSDRKKASLFFQALKELPKEEIEFLASKYYYSEKGCCFKEEYGNYATYIPITDQEAAVKHDMKPREYAKKRQSVENHLKQALERCRLERLARKEH